MDTPTPELEADVRVFARFWMEHQERLAAAGPEDGVAFGDAVLLAAMTAAVRPDAIVQVDEPGADLTSLGLNDILLFDTPRLAGAGELDEALAKLPALRPGVLVRLTGVVTDEELAAAPAPNQAWNRAVRAAVAGDPDYEVVFFNRLFRQELAPLIEATLPRFLDEPGAGLWLRKLGAARG